jgi:hypothetical protein
LVSQRNRRRPRAASPEGAAAGIVAGIEAGDEDVFPDPMSCGMGAGYYADPKAGSRDRFAAMVV